MKVLVDHNISPRVARALNEVIYDAEVVSLQDKFPTDTADEEWLISLGQEGGWSLLTKDLRIVSRKAEKQALAHSKVTSFFLERGWSKRENLQTTAYLLLRWPSLRETVKLVQDGALFRVPINAGSRLRSLTP